MWKSRLDGSPEEYSPDHRREQIAQEHADQIRGMKALLGRVEHVSLRPEDDNFAPKVIGPDWKKVKALWHHFAGKDIRAAIHTYLELEDGVITKIIQLSSQISKLSHPQPSDLWDTRFRDILFRAHESLEHYTQLFRALEYAIEICAAWAKLSDSHGYAPRDLISQLGRSKSDPKAYQTWLDAARHEVQPRPHHFELMTRSHTLKDPHISNTPPSDAPHLNATMLEWQVLPPDWLQRSSQREFTHKRLAKERLDRILELEKYKPDRWYEGRHQLGEHTYFVADFGSIVVADSPDLGNALYYLVLPEAQKWKEIFHLPKKQALDQGAKRIVHGKMTWQDKLAGLMRAYRSKRNGCQPSAGPMASSNSPQIRPGVRR